MPSKSGTVPGWPDRRVTVGWIAALGLFGAIAAAAVFGLNQLARDGAQVDRAGRTVALLEAQLGSTVETGWALRGFLLSGDNDYLAPYGPAVTVTRHRIDFLRTLLDDPDGRRQLDVLTTLMNRRLVIIDSIVETAHRQGLAPARERWREGTVTRLQDSVRASILRLQFAERERLATARQTSEASSRRLTLVILTGTISAILIIIGGALIIWRSFGDARRADEALRAANASLDTRVRERTAELERVAAAHRLTETRLENLVAAAPVVLGETRYGPNGERSDWFAPDRFFELFGVPAEAALKVWSPGSGVPPDELARLQASATAAMTRMLPWHDEFRYRHPTRGEIWIEAMLRPVPDPDGGSSWYGAMLDITDRKRTELALAERAVEAARANAELTATRDALQASEERFAKAFQSAPTANCLVRLSDRVIVEANAAFLEEFGLTRDALVGRAVTTSCIGLASGGPDHLWETLARGGQVRG